MIIARFIDDEYQVQPITCLRHTVRVFLHTQDDTYIFLKLHGQDNFGEREGIESVGGGMEGFENMEETLRREVREETGYEVLSFRLIGTIIDRYNLIQRETHSHFFLAEVDTSNKGSKSLTEMEKNLVEGVIELTYDEVLDILNHPKNKVSKLIYRRDLLAFNKIYNKKEA